MTGTSEERAERIAAEKAEQARWRFRTRRPENAWFGRLLETEFLPPEQQAEAGRNRIARMAAYAGAAVPYYRDLIARLKLVAADIAGPERLPLLPLLDKTIIRAETARLRPAALPKGEIYAGSNRSSGSTGAPTVVHRTLWTRFLDLVIEQRQQRWHRIDPTGTMAWIRLAKNIPPIAPGRLIGLGETSRADSWPYLDRYFITGPFCGFADENPIAEQIAWLEANRPNYMRVASGNLEHLAFGFQDRPRLESLRGIKAAAEPLSPGMQARIEAAFGVPVHVAYGMDEVGWIASRCESGRYHVHTERFFVEIADEKGMPVPPGQFGRILLTDIGNAAMPLFRYVTDDVALALEGGPCPCGRTLPAFGEIIGRHSRMAGLPEGTMPLVAALRETMERLPRELSLPVREYQVRQDLRGDFTLCVVAAGPLSPGFSGYVMNVWRKALAGRTGRPPALSIAQVPENPRAPSGKFFHFVSDLARPAEAKDRAEAAPIRPAGGGAAI